MKFKVSKKAVVKALVIYYSIGLIFLVIFFSLIFKDNSVVPDIRFDNFVREITSQGFWLALLLWPIYVLIFISLLLQINLDQFLSPSNNN